MRNFHAKNITNTGTESFYAQTINNGNPTGSNYYPVLDDIVQSTYGFHHYDVPDIHAPSNNWTSQLTNSHLLPEYQQDGFSWRCSKSSAETRWLWSTRRLSDLQCQRRINFFQAKSSDSTLLSRARPLSVVQSVFSSQARNPPSVNLCRAPGRMASASVSPVRVLKRRTSMPSRSRRPIISISSARSAAVSTSSAAPAGPTTEGNNKRLTEKHDTLGATKATTSTVCEPSFSSGIEFAGTPVWCISLIVFSHVSRRGW